MDEGNDALLADIDALLACKRAAPEMGLEPQVASIHAFVESELARLETVIPVPAQRHGIAPQLNELFRCGLDEAWR